MENVSRTLDKTKSSKDQLEGQSNNGFNDQVQSMSPPCFEKTVATLQDGTPVPPLSWISWNLGPLRMNNQEE